MSNRVLVCVTQQRSCERLIEQGRLLLADENDSIHVVHVVKEDWKYFGQLKEPDALEYLFEAAQSVGAELTVIKDRDIENTLAIFAKKHNITDIVMGESLEKEKQQNMIKRLQSKTKNYRFHIVSVSQDEKEWVESFASFSI